MARRLPRLSRGDGAVRVGRFGERQRLPGRTARAFTTGAAGVRRVPDGAVGAARPPRHWRGARDEVMGYRRSLRASCRACAAAIAGAPARRIAGSTATPSRSSSSGARSRRSTCIGSAAARTRGDRVWFENPGAIGARNSLIASGAELVPMPVDDQGMRVDEALRLAPRFRLAFVTPVAPAAARRDHEPRAPLRAPARRGAGRRMDRRGRLRRRILVRRQSAADAEERRRAPAW